MKPGDLVRIREFCRLDLEWDCFGILAALHEDDEGCLWCKIIPFETSGPDKHYWYEDYAIEVVSEM